MGAIFNLETKMYDWESPHESWMKCPSNLTEEEVSYLTILESVFTVETPSGKWVHYVMAPHQVWFHLFDFTLKKGKSKNMIVKKSRNTSFPVSSMITLIMASIEVENPVCPIIKLNGPESEELINKFYELTKHIEPIDIDGVKMPFNPNDIKGTAVKKLTMANGNVFKAFPANSDAAENVRGTRTRIGLIDEANFMRKFVDLFTALRKASYGTLENGDELFQLLIGTTLKGETPYVAWQEALEIRAKPLTDNTYIRIYNNFVIFDWPIFERIVFEKYYNNDPDNEIPFHENEELISLVPWQHKRVLWEDYCLDCNIFLEENMAIKVDSDEQFYPMLLIMDASESILRLIDETEFEQIKQHYHEVIVGVDVASVHDYFVITMIGKKFDGKYEQFYLTYENKVKIEDMQHLCERLLHALNLNDIKWRLAIDANGIGLHITQNLQTSFGEDKVRGIKGGSIKDTDGNSHRLNEYGHTKVKRMLSKKDLLLLEDEMQIKHFAGWNYDYKCESTGIGHGDITMAVLYAIISEDYKSIGEARLYSSSEGKKSSGNKDSWFIRDFNKKMRQKIMR